MAGKAEVCKTPASCADVIRSQLSVAQEDGSISASGFSQTSVHRDFCSYRLELAAWTGGKGRGLQSICPVGPRCLALVPGRVGRSPVPDFLVSLTALTFRVSECACSLAKCDVVLCGSISKGRLSVDQTPLGLIAFSQHLALVAEEH
jgi:hypothetical protein